MENNFRTRVSDKSVDIRRSTRPSSFQQAAPRPHDYGHQTRMFNSQEPVSFELSRGTFYLHYAGPMHELRPANKRGRVVNRTTSMLTGSAASACGQGQGLPYLKLPHADDARNFRRLSMVGSGGALTGRDQPQQQLHCTVERNSTNGAPSVAGDHDEVDGSTSFQMAHRKLRDKVTSPSHEHDVLPDRTN